MLDVMLAFWGGGVSFLSPCFLPLVPGYFALISGLSYQEMGEQNMPLWKRSQVMLWTCLFCAGMLVIFMMMGFLVSRTQSFFLPLPWISTISGLFFMGMGVCFLSNTMPSWKGSWMPAWMSLERTWIPSFSPKLRSRKVLNPYERSLLCFVSGGLFAVSWIPCTGPILALILLRISQNDQMGTLMMLFYGLGRCLPLIIMAFFLPQLKILRGHSWGRPFQIMMATILLGFGGLMITGQGQSFLASLALSFWPSMWFKSVLS